VPSAHAFVVDDVEYVEGGVVAVGEIDRVDSSLGCGVAAIRWKQHGIVHI